MKKHVYCSTGITPQFHDIFVQFILGQQDMTELELYLTTPGGNPFTGFNLYSFIKSLQIETTVYNIGTVDSAGVQFFLGFKNRFAVENATFMVHQVKFARDILPPMYTRFDLLTALREIESVENKTEQVILKETVGRARDPLTLDAVRSAIFQTTVSNAQTALEHGVIDAIRQPAIPKEDVLYVTEDYLALLRQNRGGK